MKRSQKYSAMLLCILMCMSIFAIPTASAEEPMEEEIAEATVKPEGEAVAEQAENAEEFPDSVPAEVPENDAPDDTQVSSDTGPADETEDNGSEEPPIEPENLSVTERENLTETESEALPAMEEEPALSAGTAKVKAESKNASEEKKPFVPIHDKKTRHFLPKETKNDNSLLLDAYAEKELGLKNGTSSGGAHKAPRNPTHGFTEAQIAVYSSLVDCIAETAAGTRSCSIYSLEFDDLSCVTWPASELGYDEVTYDNYMDVAGAAYDRFLDFNMIHNALLAVCPYELFWHDKTIGVFISYGISSEDGLSITIPWLEYTFAVADAYTDGETTDVGGGYYVNTGVLTGIGTSIRRAVNYANDIVETCTVSGDAGRLRYYKEIICAEVSYNNGAIENDEAYGPPWQLIWVFDRDSDTNVVCEGYSKAFQYLCDLTQEKGLFVSDLTNCISVSGKMDGGDHMWNIVTMENGKNYLVDVTNCDEGTVGENDLLFLVGYSSVINNGYVFSPGGQTLNYVYDDETLSYYTDVERTICDSDYEEQQQQYSVSYDANGGTGAPAAQTKIHDVALTVSSAIPTRADDSRPGYTVTLNPNGGSVSPTSLSASWIVKYTFKNWNTKADGGGTAYNAGSTYFGNADLTLYAQFKYDITMSSVILPTPTRNGYSFLGWGSAADADQGVTGEYYPSDESVTLYAIWQKDAVTDPVEEYVRRCYLLLLDREGDAGGVGYWTSELKSGKQGGASIVDQFVSSKEFVNKNLSNAETVRFIYRTMLNREPDAGGLAYWQSFLDDGASPHYIVSGFSGAKEFKDLCASYGINAGKINLTEYRDKNIKVTQFVNRNYQYALERKGEAGGLNYWCELIINRKQTPKQCAQSFVFSKECVNRNLNNREFVEMLYRLYMGREADQGGLNYWLGQMNKGMSRQKVANSFADSQEFKNIVKSYGL